MASSPACEILNYQRPPRERKVFAGSGDQGTILILRKNRPFILKEPQSLGLIEETNGGAVEIIGDLPFMVFQQILLYFMEWKKLE
jgi:hypothetical protein